eukprot:CAMPEP_0117677730 /NCGR_PEP_ID=MMETSP0804-20121206/16900_1 /TAXON_ID=1074897 /ORGANISM="Tetraselmis astigmatica, Strain CCMP880" /LENGTH=149 /DNA_ID=CAMNT_0005487031 /DNA_START=71 /DNA_END=520 /DNA_ORIENTATION=+
MTMFASRSPSRTSITCDARRLGFRAAPMARSEILRELDDLPDSIFNAINASRGKSSRDPMPSGKSTGGDCAPAAETPAPSYARSPCRRSPTRRTATLTSSETGMPIDYQAARKAICPGAPRKLDRVRTAEFAPEDLPFQRPVRRKLQLC